MSLVDLHTHTFFSDGVLGPAELMRRVQVAGYQALAYTDHADISNMHHIIPDIAKFCQHTQKYVDIMIIPGIELTHVPPGQIASLVREARRMGAQIVLLHGETICEPVAPGTNRAGIEAGIDILAHPGLISEDEVRLAKERGVFLEITTRSTHGIANGHVTSLARRFDVPLVINSDFHAPGDNLTIEKREKTALGTGLSSEEYNRVLQNSVNLVQGLEKKKTSI